MNRQRLELYVDGVASRPIYPDIDKGFITYAYSHLDSKHSISLYDFDRGYAVFHIKNTPGDPSSDMYRPINEHRHPSLEIQFSKPLKCLTVVFIQGHFPRLLPLQVSEIYSMNEVL